MSPEQRFGGEGSSPIEPCHSTERFGVAVQPGLWPALHTSTTLVRTAQMVDNELVFSALAEFTHTLVQRYAIADVLTHLTFQVPAALDIFGAGVSVGDEDGMLRFAT